MDWGRIEGNWAWWRRRIHARWGRLTREQLDVVAGRRDQLAAQIEESYGLSPAEAERQLLNWERNLAPEDFGDIGGTGTTGRS